MHSSKPYPPALCAPVVNQEVMHSAGLHIVHLRAMVFYRATVNGIPSDFRRAVNIKFVFNGVSICFLLIRVGGIFVNLVFLIVIHNTGAGHAVAHCHRV